MSGEALKPVMLAPPSRAQVEDFLIDEAAMLDDEEWAAWNALFTPDGLYWVPASPTQESPTSHVSVMLENDLLRKVRIKRFEAPDAYSLQPFPRSTHMVSNIRITHFDDATGLTQVRSKFMMLLYQREITTPYGGTYRHDLLWDGTSFKIKQKRVDLINCDGPLDCINLYF